MPPLLSQRPKPKYHVSYYRGIGAWRRYALCDGLWLRFRSLFKKPWSKSAIPSCCHDMIIEGSKGFTILTRPHRYFNVLTGLF